MRQLSDCYTYTIFLAICMPPLKQIRFSKSILRSLFIFNFIQVLMSITSVEFAAHPNLFYARHYFCKHLVALKLYAEHTITKERLKPFWLCWSKRSMHDIRARLKLTSIKATKVLCFFRTNQSKLVLFISMLSVYNYRLFYTIYSSTIFLCCHWTGLI